MLKLNVPLILILMNRTGMTFKYVQDKLEEIDIALRNQPWIDRG